jgi:hypothetical protein
MAIARSVAADSVYTGLLSAQCCTAVRPSAASSRQMQRMMAPSSQWIIVIIPSEPANRIAST